MTRQTPLFAGGLVHAGGRTWASSIEHMVAASVAGSDSPLYRFRGHQPPVAGSRSSVLAAVDGAKVEEDGTAVLRLYDPIDSWGGEWGVSAKEFSRALDQLPGETSSIRLHINSPGGEVFEGLAILNMLRQHPANVTAVVDGLAASAASFIAAGADNVLVAPNSEVMIHDAWGLAMGPARVMHDLGDRLNAISDNIASVYAEKAGGDVQTWRDAMLAETWYSAQEAVDAGLADGIYGAKPADEEAAAAARASFDLSVFAHQGRDDAPSPVLPRHDPGPVPGEAEAASTDDATRRAAARARRLALEGARIR